MNEELVHAAFFDGGSEAFSCMGDPGLLKEFEIESTAPATYIKESPWVIEVFNILVVSMCYIKVLSKDINLICFDIEFIFYMFTSH